MRGGDDRGVSGREFGTHYLLVNRYFPAITD